MNLPEPGFYYHYKHDPDESFNNYAYEVLGTGFHTEMPHEDADSPEDAMFVVYRPLYESAFVYKLGKLFDVRPLKLFIEDVKKNGVVMKRFTPITNLALISKLELQAKKLYSQIHG